MKTFISVQKEGKVLRNYKFRAWDRKNKAMLKVTTVDFSNGICFSPSREKHLDFWNYETALMQSTELKDRNENEMYEGDVIKGKEWSKGKSHRHIGVVTYVGGEFRSVGVKQYCGYNGSVNGSYEIIGNIYENPELVE